MVKEQNKIVYNNIIVEQPLGIWKCGLWSTVLRSNHEDTNSHTKLLK